MDHPATGVHDHWGRDRSPTRSGVVRRNNSPRPVGIACLVELFGWELGVSGCGVEDCESRILEQLLDVYLLFSPSLAAPKNAGSTSGGLPTDYRRYRLPFPEKPPAGAGGQTPGRRTTRSRGGGTSGRGPCSHPVVEVLGQSDSSSGLRATDVWPSAAPVPAPGRGEPPPGSAARKGAKRSAGTAHRAGSRCHSRTAHSLSALCIETDRPPNPPEIRA